MKNKKLVYPEDSAKDIAKKVVEITKSKEQLLEIIEHFNDRLIKLKAQGESNTKTVKNMRYRRNKHIKELVKILAPEVDFASIINEIREK
jgi:demethoxyubiquinone hydroxylase (CLK1/Coq7/Cat5 family)